MYYVPESDLRDKSYDHLNFLRASIVQFRASLYVIRLNRTSELKVMTIWISRELPLFYFERLNILCAGIWPPWEKWWPFYFYRELPLFNLERLDILWALIGPPSDKLWPFEFLESFRCSILSISKCYGYLNYSRASVVQFRASRYVLRLNLTSVWKVITIWISRELPLFNFERLDILCTSIGPPS